MFRNPDSPRWRRDGIVRFSSATKELGTVVDAGGDARELVGRKVALRDGTYSLFRVLRAADCLLLPEGVPARDGAAACINPLTVLSMIETMRREGHKAIVHTAAASNVGQMLNRVCLEDNIGLVNIVRDARAAELLRAAGAKYVLDSTQEDFHNRLVDALVATGATIAFDAIGGGPLLSQILTAMEIGAEISLREMLNPEMVKRYTKTGTGEKFLVKMDG